MKKSCWPWAMPGIVLLALIFACSGDPGPRPAVSGVAATGVPIAGTVTLKDRDGLLSGPVATDADGNYRLDVTGLAPPFLLKAEWSEGTQSRALYSAAFGEGQTHINPLTHLALQLATGGDPATLYGAAGAVPDTAQVSRTGLDAAVGQLRTLLQPLLDDCGITAFDPLKGPYTAKPTNRLDALLDVVSVTAVNGQLTVVNRLTGAAIASGAAAAPAALVLDRTRFPAGAVLDDLADLTGRIRALGEAMRLGSALTAADLEGFFVADPNYGTSGGHTRSQDIASIVALFGPQGSNTNGPLKELRNLRLVSDLTARYAGRGVGSVYLLNYDFVYAGGKALPGHNVTFGRETATGLWKFIGDPSDGTVGSNYGGLVGRFTNAGAIDSSHSEGSHSLIISNWGGSAGVVGSWCNSGILTTPTGCLYCPASFFPTEFVSSAPFTSADLVSGSWSISWSGSLVQVAYRSGGQAVPCAELDLATSMLRLRTGSGWSPGVLVKPSLRGDRSAYRGGPVTAQWAGPSAGEAGDAVTLMVQWGGEGNASGEQGFAAILLSPPGATGLSASIQLLGSAAPDQVTQFLPFIVAAGPYPVAQLATAKVIVGSTVFPLPPSGPISGLPLSATALSLTGLASGAVPGLTATFGQAVTVTGEVVVDPQDAQVRLYGESAGYYRDLGLFEGGYTLVAGP